jgi:cytochrome c-type biogenesis protein CcmH
VRALALAAALAAAGPAWAQEPSAPPAVSAPAGGAVPGADAAPSSFGPSEDKQEDPRDVVGAPRGRKLAGAELDTRTEEVGGLLRCPVCQGLSVADSPAAMAVNMKARVRELLAEGYDEEQILAYFERSYGEFVRLEPPRRGINWLVWLAPPLALAGGLVLLTRVMKRQRQAPPPSGAASAPPERAIEDPDLAPYVLRVRELAYGWPGGTPPADAK